jgi:hypothetical protein
MGLYRTSLICLFSFTKLLQIHKFKRHLENEGSMIEVLKCFVFFQKRQPVAGKRLSKKTAKGDAICR